MPVSGLVIQVDPSRQDTIREALNALEHVEVVPTPAGEALVVVVDVSSMVEEQDLFKQINDIPGVHNVALSYHNFEDISEDESNSLN